MKSKLAPLALGLVIVAFLVACEETTPKLTSPTQLPQLPPPIDREPVIPVTLAEIQGKTSEAIRIIPNVPGGFLQALRNDLVAFQSAGGSASVRMTPASEHTTAPAGTCPSADVQQAVAALADGMVAPMTGCYQEPLPGEIVITLEELRIGMRQAIDDGVIPEDLVGLAEAALRSLDAAPPMVQASAGFHRAVVGFLETTSRWIEGVVAGLPPELAEAGEEALRPIIEAMEEAVTRMNGAWPYVAFPPTAEQLQLVDAAIAALAELDGSRPEGMPSMAPLVAASRDLRREWAALAS